MLCKHVEAYSTAKLIALQIFAANIFEQGQELQMY